MVKLITQKCVDNSVDYCVVTGIIVLLNKFNNPLNASLFHKCFIMRHHY